ncbi:transposase [Rathayibacter agropyri]|uniref:transposase n=1 Tax=Rathayibacter agropyri TaxID=1634927 RepID=UPI001CA3DDF8
MDSGVRCWGSRAVGDYFYGFHPTKLHEEYKRDAIALISDGGYTVAEVARQIDVSETSIRNLPGANFGPA